MITIQGKREQEKRKSNVKGVYTINNKDVGAEFTEATYKVQGEHTDLTIDIAQTEWDAAFAGDYSDTVSFNISYVDAQ